MYERILLAADGSEYSLRAAEETVKLAALAKNTEIEIVFVIDYSKVKSEVLQSQNPETLEFERRQKLLPVEELFTREGIQHKTTMLHGDPGPVIVEYANKQACDMVVVGSRGLNSLQEMVLGSVSHKIAKRVNCPVLIVK
ncbi:universal stress protein [Lederbergia sp. NSJ-179]|uniref:universal stress protein n=1 Tax=Lederbergia sp. NSJ-179 TaxID=2931402 RepID=UPI001FD584C6|nr:universal stress protein [Lederbergia sp. NSJ-179]MCJ7842372.1 universal stress protein [Lederbergia sp. NSJ-179]